MPLKITLKPHERLILGGAVVTNGSSSSSFTIENNVLILREKDIIREEDATSPCKRIYFIVQLMYIDEKNLTRYHKAYWENVRELTDAVKTMIPYVDQMNEHIISSEYYKALKTAKKMIAYEEELIRHATGRS
ncbi:putative flagellum biosynthesis repressor protein FlbT 1 [Geobacter sp. OR-1]|uniref:flagellar biosynthesis repressor FlbT n=1 Tax=Geobacter sp. OR-1 TaxID=1266765 RepID=UPI000541C2A0|nr:flagellar biosynthesis repressor FlbT [Geobacter sp. OR-1]GAM09660.1 putative flagellum biosynthesis repressor protein FlbT 1 [Geobacter sp. OR-1]